jgi:beta propeller repeat protein
VATATTKRLTSSIAAQVDPAIDGRRIVWADRRNGNWDIYLYDTLNKATTRLTTNGADQTAPAISGTMVVYQDRRNGNWDIYGYDLATKKEQRLTRNAADQTAPALSPRLEREPRTLGWRVVYADARNGASDIYLTDTVAGGEFRLTDDGADQLAPAISGGKAVWTDLRDTSSGSSTADVYRGVLETPWIYLAADPTVVNYNGTTTLSGTLLLGGEPVASAKLVLSPSPRLWTGWAITDAYGEYSLDVTKIKAKTSFRMVYHGDATHLPAVSEAKTVKAKAWVSTPAIPREFSYQKTVTVSCFLKPRHAAGSSPVKFLFSRYYRADGEFAPDWHVWKTVKGKAANYSTYTRCTARVSLPKPPATNPVGEKWRVVATHADSSHASSVSAYRAFTVTPYVVVTF